MGFYEFTVLEDDGYGHAGLIGLSITVETYFERFAAGVRVLDEDGLREWSVHIAADVIKGNYSHHDLLNEGVHIRIASGDEVIIDTISNRE